MDAFDNLIYASLSRSDSTSPNTVVSIDPVSQRVGLTQPSGTDLNLLAVSSDGSYLWVGDDGDGAIKRFDLPGLTPDVQISLPSLPAIGAVPAELQTAVAFAAAPDNPHTLAVVIGDPSDSPVDTGGLTVYDDATPRSASISPLAAAFSWVQWGQDSTVLYGGNNLTPPQTYKLQVTSSGAVASAPHNYTMDAPAHFDAKTNALYSDIGEVVSGTDFTALAAYPQNTNLNPTVSQCIPDSSLGTTFCLSVSGSLSTWDIQAFDQKTFRLLRTLSLPNVDGVPGRLIRWGDAGLAFNVKPFPYATAQPSGNTVYLVSGGFVDGTRSPAFNTGAAIDPLPQLASITPQTVTAGSPQVTLTLSGNGFKPGASAYVAGKPVATSYQNAATLQATVPANLLSSSAAVPITVSNGDNTSLASTILFLSVEPADSGIDVLNLQSQDVAWDATSGMLYVPTWGYDSQYPNSVVAIDPSSGQVTKSQFVGSNQYLVRTSSDGAYVYAATLNSNSIVQLSLPQLSPALTWQLGLDPKDGSYVAFDVQPAPGSPHTTAVGNGLYQINPSDPLYGNEPAGGLRIYDNDAMRPVQALENFQTAADYYTIQWGSDANTLYAAGNRMYALSVNASGVTQTNSTYLNNAVSALHYDPGTKALYADDGAVFNPSTGTQSGSFSVTGPTVPDSGLNRIFVISQTASQLGSSDYTISSFDETTLQQVSSKVIPNVFGEPVKLIRWGDSGLAFATYKSYAPLAQQPWGMLYIVNDATFVSGQ